MKYAAMMFAAGTFAFTTAVATTPAISADAHSVVPISKVEWGKGPPSLPPGTQAVALYGSPAKAGLFAYRIKLPAGYHIPPHTHTQPEVVTVLSGTLRLGMGPNADKNKTRTLPAGSFFAFEPGEAHYVYTDEETVIQLNSTGPWTIEYVKPADDPRK